MNAIPFAAKAACILLSLAALSGNARADQQCALGGKDGSAIQELCPFKDGLARIKIDHQWGFINLAGQFVIKPQFDLVLDFSDGFAIAQAGEKWGVIDKQGNWVVNPRFERLDSFSQGLAAAEENDRSGFIDPTGKWVIEPKYENAGSFYGPVAVVSEGYRRDIMIDRTGAVVKRFGPDMNVYNYANNSGLFEAHVEFKPTLRHLDGRTLPYPDAALPYFDTAYQEGRLIASEKVRRGEETVELRGAVDLQGTWVIPAKFNSLRWLGNGLAIASPDRGENAGREMFGVIDKRGEYVIEPAYLDIRDEQNGYYHAIHHGNAGKTDVLGKDGKILFTAECSEGLSEESNRRNRTAWTVYAGCGKTWVLHRALGLIPSKVIDPEVSVSGDYMMLVGAAAGAGNGDNADKVKAFELYKNDGKLVLDSSAPAVQGKYDGAMLIPASGMLAQQGRHLLPVAILVGEYEKVAVVTRDHAVVTNPEWRYDSDLRAYDYARDGVPVDGPLIMRTEEGWGAVDADGKWVVQPKYRKLSPFSNGAAYADTRTDELIVDNQGKEHKFPEKGRGFRRVAPFVLQGSEGGEEVIRLDLKSGSITSTKISQSGRMEIGTFHDGLAPAKNDDLWGLVDKDMKWIVPARFASGIEPVLHEGRLIAWKSESRRQDAGSYDKQVYGLLDTQGKELLPPQFKRVEFDAESGMIFVSEDDSRHGFYALDGKPVIAPFHGKAVFLGDGWFALAKDETQGLLDTRGEWVLQPSPVSVSNFSRGEEDAPANRPYIFIGEGMGRKLMDIQGRISTREAPLALGEDKPEWWWPEGHDKYGDAEYTAFYGFDFRERMRLPGRVHPYDRFSEGVVAFTPRNQTDVARIGLADSTGKVLGIYPFESIEPMRNGFAMVTQQLPPKRHGKKGARQEEEDHDQGSRYGYLNRQGKLAIPLKFEVASNFREGRAAVIADGNLALIDEQGRFILQGAWVCGRQAAILDGKKKILWPDEAKNIRSCAR